jgi:hypothetical protein
MAPWCDPKPSVRLTWGVLFTLQACGTPQHTEPTQAIAIAIAPAEGPTCKHQPLEFKPVEGARYRMTVDESDRTKDAGVPKHYASSVVFGRRQPTGWNATEGEFREAFSPWTYGDLTGAEIVWRLDAGGIPDGTHEVKWARGDRAVLENLSMFSFRPFGVVTRSACQGEEFSASWDNGRLRSMHYRVLSANEREVRLHFERVTVPSQNEGSVWRSEGEMDLDRSDGLSGVAHIHVMGPLSPRMNDYDRVLRISHE